MVTQSLLIGSDIFIILVGLGTAGLFTWLNASNLDFPGPMKTMAAVNSLSAFPQQFLLSLWGSSSVLFPAATSMLWQLPQPKVRALRPGH